MNSYILAAMKPTASELEILGVLWERGKATVREVHGVLEKRRATGYTTVLKLMQIMADKGLVVRDESMRAHVYSPREKRETTQRQLLTDLLDRVFGGSPALLLQQALSSRRASAEELAEIRGIVEQHEKARRGQQQQQQQQGGSK